MRNRLLLAFVLVPLANATGDEPTDLAPAAAAQTGGNDVVDDRPFDAAEDEERAKKRLEFFMSSLGQWEIVEDADEPVTAKLAERPSFRYSAPEGDHADGIVAVYSDGGRPSAVAQFSVFSHGQPIFGIYSTVDGPFTFRRNGDNIHRSEFGYIHFKPIDDAEPPSGDLDERREQMITLAKEFTVFDEFGWKETVRTKTELHPEPIHRYTDEADDVIDGGLMIFTVNGGDPEAAMLIEAREINGERTWYAGFTPLTIYELEADRNDKSFYYVEERRKFCRGFEMMYECTHPKTFGDLNMADLLPVTADGR